MSNKNVWFFSGSNRPTWPMTVVDGVILNAALTVSRIWGLNENRSVSMPFLMITAGDFPKNHLAAADEQAKWWVVMRLTRERWSMCNNLLWKPADDELWECAMRTGILKMYAKMKGAMAKWWFPSTCHAPHFAACSLNFLAIFCVLPWIQQEIDLKSTMINTSKDIHHKSLGSGPLKVLWDKEYFLH